MKKAFNKVVSDTQPRYVFAAPRVEQFRRAAYLEIAFRAYAVSIGCTIIQDEITATLAQAALLRAWWGENRLPPRAWWGENRLPPKPAPGTENRSH
jgi:hypothetical protein